MKTFPATRATGIYNRLAATDKLVKTQNTAAVFNNNTQF